MKEKAILEKISKIAFNCPGIIEYYGTKKLEIEFLYILN